jgi:hypothetical protein
MKHTLITLSTLLLIGCGSRKVTTQKEVSKEQTEQTATTETKTDTNETVKVVDTSTVDEIEFIPIDNSKPIVVNGKSYLNVKIKHVKRKNNVTTQTVKKVAETSRNEVKTKVRSEVKVKDKVIERESVSYWWLWILILGVVYLLYRKYLK